MRSDRADGLDLHKGVVEPAPSTPVGRFFGGQRVHRLPPSRSIVQPAKRHPGDARPDARRYPAARPHVAASVPYAYDVSIAHAAARAVVRMQLDDQLALAPAMVVDVAVTELRKWRVLPVISWRPVPRAMSPGAGTGSSPRSW